VESGDQEIESPSSLLLLLARNSTVMIRVLGNESFGIYYGRSFPGIYNSFSLQAAVLLPAAIDTNPVNPFIRRISERLDNPASARQSIVPTRVTPLQQWKPNLNMATLIKIRPFKGSWDGTETASDYIDDITMATEG
jgi:hypothetical protein